MSDQAPSLHRIRLHYTRAKELRYVSTLDMQLVWERTLRRARLPVAFTQGFTPRVRFHMACALPLGFTSTDEVADLWLAGDAGTAEVVEKLNAAAPPGLVVKEAVEIPLSLPALQTRVEYAEYSVLLSEVPDGFDLPASVEKLLRAQSLPRTRREKAYDLRPLIDRLEVVSSTPPELWMRLSAREGATGRADEVLLALGLDPTAARIERTRLVFKED